MFRVVDSAQFAGGGECGAVTVAKGSISSLDDNSKAAKNQRNAQASVLASLPKVKVRWVTLCCSDLILSLCFSLICFLMTYILVFFEVNLRVSIYIAILRSVL